MPPPSRSIQWRILSRLGPILALAFGIILYGAGATLKDSLYSVSLESAKASSLMAVYAVQAAMATDTTHQIWDRVVEKIGRHGSTSIEIINPHGVVLFSTERRRGTRLYGDWCRLCHGTAQRADTAFMRDPNDELYQLLAAPLRNERTCQRCHAKAGSKLGVVLVRRSLQPLLGRLRRLQLGSALVGAMALLVTIFAVRGLLARHLGRPLQKLVAGAQAIGAGQLQHSIVLDDAGDLEVLANTLNSSAAHLAKLQQELVNHERLAAIGETVAGLAHCVKNILNGLRAGQYVIDGAIEKPNQEKLRQGWQVMKNTIQQVERLTADMLYCAKDRVPQLAPTSPNEVVREVIALLRDGAEERGVELRPDLDEGAGQALLDRTAVYRAILNLATNAIDACLECEHGSLVVLSSRSGPDDVVLAVRDNGVGIPEPVRRQIFMRCFSTKGGRGTGLGLSVVKKIADEHGGRLELESTPGEGSVFRLIFPRNATGARRTDSR